MPILFQKRIYRSDLEMNPHAYYCFGDNDARKGVGGQAKEMRGERNAIGIRTKKAPRTGVGVYYTDDEYEENIAKINEDFNVVMDLLDDGRLVVFPTEGFGTGLAELKERAPETLKYINKVIEGLVEIYG